MLRIFMALLAAFLPPLAATAQSEHSVPEIMSKVEDSCHALNEVVLDWCDEQGGEFAVPALCAPGCKVDNSVWATSMGVMDYDDAWWWDKRSQFDYGYDYGLLWFVWPTEAGCKIALNALENPARVPVTLIGPNARNCYAKAGYPE